MPQTREHLEILDLLAVEHGLVAVTKTDVVDDVTVELAVELTREMVARTSLAEAAVVPVSAVTGDNLSRLRNALNTLLDAVPAETDIGRPGLWVDRSFSIRGAGTVVTGTLRHGSLTVGDELVVLPGDEDVRVRGMQGIGRQLDRAEPGGRLAVNLVGLSRDETHRGDALVRPGQWIATRQIEAWVRSLADRQITRRGDWHLHCGSGEWRAEIRPVDARPIPPGSDGFVRLELDRPVPMAPGDRFVLKESGYRTTVGGGVLLDVAPGRAAKGRASRDVRIARLTGRMEALSAGDRIGWW